MQIEPLIGVDAPAVCAWGEKLTPERRLQLEAYIIPFARQKPPDSTWSDPAALRRVVFAWEAEIKSAEIARQMGMSKNQVIGVIHRFIAAGAPLDYRESPINRAGERAPRPARKSSRELEAARICNELLSASDAPAPGANLDLLVEPPTEKRPVVRHKPIFRDKGLHGAPPPAEPPSSCDLPPDVVLYFKPRAPCPCVWPIDIPGTTRIMTCDAESLPGKPYCEEHAALAYVKVRSRHDGENSARQVAAG